MQAIRYVEKGKAELGTLDPGPIPAGHVRLGIKAAGLCHTDIDVLHGRYGEGTYPVTPGHEFAGVVEALGEGVTMLRIGDRVAVDPNLPCGACRSCAKGLTNLCRNLKAYGVSTNGGFAETSVVAADHCHKIGDLSFPVAALAEPLACVLNGLSSAGLVPVASAGLVPGGARPENALVFGAGPIGLLLALSLKAEGVGEVVVADLNESRLSFAESLGLGTALSGSDDLAGRRGSYDFVAEATGIPAVVEGMIPLVADGGTALVFGVAAPDARVRLSPFDIFRRQLKVVGSHSLNRNIPEALAILRRDTGAMARLVSHRLALPEILPFILTKSTDPNTMKVQFVAE